ncbi:transcription factor/nuclear export subunit protein 2-domain-containing protein [Triangularia verruculosa]|uniref:THO complex subunit 2 n=1 Tax=Triangularia verruculosa TaxID=2587418 RepID=A0AAN6XJ53_9PEZI|nr:transcription factor/nuclear export subunit protein 2-domain-containing protein [Triangularia verruculosa]
MMGPQRKRKDRVPPDSGPSRPSPHRPQDTSLGQHDRSFDGGNRNNRQGAGGGGGGNRNFRRDNRRDSSQSHIAPPPPSSAPASISPTMGRPSSASSQTPLPPLTTTVTPTPAPQSAPSSPILIDEDYTIITDDYINRWSKGARQQIIEHGVQSREDEDLTEIAVMFQELVWSVNTGRLRGIDAGGVVKEILGPEPSEEEREAGAFDPHTLFLDTVGSYSDIQTDSVRQQFHDFMMASGVSLSLMRVDLDPSVLAPLELVRDTFFRMSIRTSTNLLYRQASYNLLREETEGFSKLVTEIFTTCTNDPASSEVVQDTFNKVMGLIGTFDLNPGRVLDVTLDVFAAILVKQFRFFIKFLRFSSWWPRSQSKLPTDTYVGGLPLWALPDHESPFNSEEEDAMVAAQRLKRDVAFWERARQIKLDAFFELGGRQLTAADEERLANGTAAKNAEFKIEQEWIRITKTLPPCGNRDAAQMLGFKLRFYTSDARDPEDTLPANLLYLTALLIKVGFISLTDLWNFIWPPDEEMEEIRAEKMKELEEKERASRPGAAKNALMMAGALPDEGPSGQPTNSSRRDAGSNKADTEMKGTESTEDKPKLPKPSDQKMHLLRCLLTIGALPEALFMIGQHPWILEADPETLTLLHRILRHSIEVVYNHSRPTATASTECPPKSLPDMDQSGVAKGSVRVSTSPIKRPLRWPHVDRNDFEGGSYRFYWDEWADNIPVCQTVDDLFTLFDTLVNIVGVNIGLDADLMAKITSIGTKSLADDQSPENVNRWLEILKRLLVPALSLGEANASVSDSVWHLLKQYPISIRYNIYAEWYQGSTSRLEPIRKAFARTRLETLSILKRLSLTNIPEMAKTLAKIAYPSPGIVCKVSLSQIESYSNFIEAFVECTKYFTDLGYDVLVWSVLSSLGGQQRSRTQEDSVLLTSRWLQALSKFSGRVFTRYANMDSSPILRYVHNQLLQGNSTDLVILKELVVSMGGVVSDLDFTDAQLHAMTGGELLRRETLINLGDKRAASTRSAERLMKALTSSKLAGQLLTNIAQYRQNAIYAEEGGARIKYLATVVDDTHQILLQYLDLLKSNLDADTFNNIVPDILQLMRDFGLEANLAFLIRRSSIRWEVKGSASPTEVAKVAADGDDDVAMDAAEDNGPSSVDDADNGSSKILESRVPESLAEALAPLIEEIPSVLPTQDWRYISPSCYVFFWSLHLGNLLFPQDSYQAENTRLIKQAEEVMRDRSDMTRHGMNKKTQKRNEILDRQKLLLKEMNEGLTRFSKARVHLGRQVDSWFPAPIAKADAASDALLEECILPRLHLSPLDAEYCFRLVKFLHEFSTSNFKLMSLYDRLFNHNRLRAMVFTCTVREAEHVGRFLKLILGDLSKWHGDKNAYEKEALGLKEVSKTRQYLGFATAFDAEGKPTEFVEHDAFKDLLFKWHKELNTALRSCLNGMEWMHIRNAITVLKSVIDFFPAINFMADKFLEQLKTITEREAASKNASESEMGHRVDLSVTAQTAYSELQKRKPKWILVQAFRPGAKGDAGTATSGLRGSAVEFKPTSSRAQHAEVEDGEVTKEGAGKKKSDARARDEKHSLPQPPPREPLREPNVPGQRAGSANGPSGKPNNSRSNPAAPSSSSGRPERHERHERPERPDRPETPKFSTLPPVGHGLPNKPDLPARPEPAFPRGANDRFGSTRHDRREPTARDVRDFSRDGRDSRDSRDLREGRDARDHPAHPPLPSHPSHSRDNRDTHASRDARDFRAPEVPRSERPRDFSSDRRPAEAGPRDSTRSSERDWSTRSELPARWNEHAATPERDGRAPRDRATLSSGRHDPRGPRESPVGPSPQTGSASNASQEPPTHPDRARAIADADRPDIINPARAALMKDSNRDTPSRPGPRDQLRDRPGRTESPRRTDHSTANTAQPENIRDERHGRHRHSDHHSTSRDGRPDSLPSHPRQDRNQDHGPSHSRADRNTEHGQPHGRQDRNIENAPSQPRQDRVLDNAPSQPRSDRNVERDDRTAGPRDSSFGGPPRSDPEHGRLNQQDPNYGRLQPIQSVVDMPSGAPPSGPRGRGGRNTTRMGPSNNGVPMRPDTRPSLPEPVRPASPERQVPTGPAAGRQRQQQRNNQFDKNNPPTVPTAPAAGVHPDRMRHINNQQTPNAPSPPPGPPTGPSGIHPDRLNQISGTPSGTGSHSRPPINTPDRPSMSASNAGPRQPPPPLNTDFATPTGPAASNDRIRSGGRQLRNIQSMIDKTSMENARGPGLRMSRSRPNLAGSDAQILAGSSPVTTPIQERPDPFPRDSGRRDMNVDRAPAAPVPIQVVGDSRSNGDDYGPSRNEHDRSRREHRSDRSNRPSRANSRERNPDRDREAKEQRDYSHTRRSGVSSSVVPNSGREDRDPNASRRSGRESLPGGGGRDMPPVGPREPSHRGGHRNDVNSGPRTDAVQLGRNDGHGGNSQDYGSGRTGPPRGGMSQSRESRGPPRQPNDQHGDGRSGGNDRKRRSEGLDSGNHQDKRPRRS